MALRDLLEQAIQQQQLENQVRRETAEQFTPSAGQVANVTGMLVPGSGIKDAKGEYPALPSYDQPVTEAFSNEPYPSMSENLKRGGFGGYFDASMQGLGVAGDALYAAPVVGPVLGATVGTGIKGLGALGTVAKAAATGSKAGKGGKGITALDETKKMLQADIDTFAKDDLGFTSPTMEALITKAPANLKGKQITEWAKGNANKGVKPKELEFLGLDEFVASNPNANVRETVEGISGNKVKVSSNIRGGGDGQVMDFDISTPTDDPLDGSKVYQHMIDDTASQLDDGDKFVQEDLVFHFNALRAEKYNETGSEKGIPNKVEGFDELTKETLKDMDLDLDDLIESYAEGQYMSDPYQLIRPTGTTASDDTFAFGNDDVGYSLFVDGKRIYNDNNIAYSQTEAQIQLRDSMANQGYDMFRLDADDFDESMDYLGGETQYKQFINNSLPGGSNYREVVFNWDNAPVRHGGFAHFDDDNQIAHALIRDRKLADGTDTLHGDEIQSDLHTKGSQDGYDTPENVELWKKKLAVKENVVQDRLEDIIKIVQNKGYTLDELGLENIPIEIKASIKEGRYGDTDNISSDFIIDISDHPKLMEGTNKLTLDELSKIENLRDATRNQLDSYYSSQKLVPNYPYKDDYFDLALKKMLLLAIEEGKPAISVSGSAPMKQRYSDRYAKFYETLYDKKIPSAMKKLSNKYGGEFEKSGKLDVENTVGAKHLARMQEDLDHFNEGQKAVDALSDETLASLDANVIRITPEMKEKILKEGIQSFGTGGIVESGITHLNTSKKKTDGIAAIATA